MFRKLAIFSMPFLFFTGMKGQAPGYMGKKMVAGYGFYFNPAFAARSFGYGDKFFNKQHEFFLEGSLKNRLAVAFSVKLYKSTYNNTGSIHLPYYYNSVARHPSGVIDIFGINYALYFKIYKRGYVAPWGRYFLTGLTINTRFCAYDPEEMAVRYDNSIKQNQPQKFNNFGFANQFYIYPDIILGGGKSRIFARRIVLDYGYTINVVALAMTGFDAFDDSWPAPQNYISINSGMRVRGINRYNIFVKLGYLF